MVSYLEHFLPTISVHLGIKKEWWYIYCPDHLDKINAQLSILIVKHKLRHLDYLLEDLDPGNICMSTGLFTILVGIFIIMCYVHDCQDDGKYICSMDALFGLPRKKA